MKPSPILFSNAPYRGPFFIFVCFIFNPNFSKNNILFKYVVIMLLLSGAVLWANGHIGHFLFFNQFSSF
jgi:hypothetical protein